MGVIMQRLTVSFLLCGALLPAQRDIPPGSLNKPERVEWFRDQGFGLFIHWSVDSQTGVVISHSLVSADEAYTKRFFEELPKTFNPRKFEPKDWAALATLAGIKYVVFTAKHHSGFAMWDTKTTDFGIMHTPYKHDLTGEILDAFRAQGIASVAMDEQYRDTVRHTGRAAAQQSRLDETRPRAGARVDDKIRADRRRVLRWRAGGSDRGEWVQDAPAERPRDESVCSGVRKK
jgi:hypothetical protein